MCPSNALSESILTPLYNSSRIQQHEHSQDVICISFEYAYQTKEPKRKKKKQKTKSSVSQNTQNAQNTQHALSVEHINKSNPIFDILHRNANSNTEKNTDKNINTNRHVLPFKTESKPLSFDSTTHEKKVHIKLITQRVWNMKAIAPLIIWLQKQHKRFCHSDWVNHYSNGERELIVSQYGTVISKEHVEEKHHYSCEGGFHNIHLRCAVNRVNHYAQTNDVEIWSSFIRKQNVYCKTYQQRIYVWDTFTTLHLHTVDGKQYNVSVQHHNPQKNEQAYLDFRRFITLLSYHLSQHVHFQKNI